MSLVQRIHHVAYRCRDAKETVEWYERHLQMRFVLAIAEDEVPSTKEPDPYMHVFLDAGGGNVLAFFELPERPPITSRMPARKSRNTFAPRMASPLTRPRYFTMRWPSRPGVVVISMRTSLARIPLLSAEGGVCAGGRD